MTSPVSPTEESILAETVFKASRMRNLCYDSGDRKLLEAWVSFEFSALEYLACLRFRITYLEEQTK